MLNEDELREAIVLVFANKQDLPNAMSAAEITDKLGLNSLRGRDWCVHISREERGSESREPDHEVSCCVFPSTPLQSPRWCALE